ncbi:MAG: M13 family metallopeptidase [Acidobacteriota bacterium]|nr:M13 family metallopeptidase [Acidobacteriota bacterium]
MKNNRFKFCVLLASMCVAGLGALLSSSHAADTPSSWGFSTANLDKSCKPCDDFYKFAMGGWMKNNPIPADRPAWSTSAELQEKNLAQLRQITEASAAAKASRGSNEQKVGDFYASCMDTVAIESAGAKPLGTQLAAIDAINDRNALLAQIAALHKEGIQAVFDFSSTQDFADSTKVIGDADQGGLGMPDRDYYLRDDDRSKQLRTDYVAHVTKMFQIAGDPAEKSAAEAQTVMNIETALAKASLTNVQLRDPQANYHKLSTAQLKELTPDWSWESFFAAVNLPGLPETNIGQPDFFKEMNHQISATSLPGWKTYLRWHIIHAAAPGLSDDFVQENFNFYGKRLSGTAELQPRWKRCVQSVNRNVGEALGQVYVEKYFPPAAKARAREMVHNLLAALRSDIPTLSWMSPETKQAAIAKMEAFNIKIGYPDKWRDYSKLDIERTSYAANLRRASTFENSRELAKIGKPVDRNEWGMTPPTVNAYYNPTMNEIVFPAGILQPPFYDPKADDAINYGGMGAVIGHEVSHGFDDEGSQFDPQGNLRNWWTADDRKNFDARAACVEKQFDTYEVEPGLHQNGKLVLGESIGDLGGLAIAYAAYEKSLEGKPRKDIDGFTPEQRFFLGWAQVWGANQRPEAARLQANTNPHPLARFRGNGPLSDMGTFAQAFGCKKGDAMVREQACKIW